MSDPKTDLMQEAIQLANQFKAKSIDLNKKLTAVQLEAKQLQADISAAESAVDRLSSFKVVIGQELQCPNCWIRQGVQSPLIAQPSENEVDNFLCQTCRYTHP